MVRRIVKHSKVLDCLRATGTPVFARRRVYIPPAIKTHGGRPRCSKQVRNMGLEAFTSDDEEEETSITTRKKLKNVTFDEGFYDWVIMNDPRRLQEAAAYTYDSSVKAMVQRMDEVVEEGIQEHNLTDKEERDIQEARDTLVEQYLE